MNQNKPQTLNKSEIEIIKAFTLGISAPTETVDKFTEKILLAAGAMLSLMIVSSEKVVFLFGGLGTWVSIITLIVSGLLGFLAKAKHMHVLVSVISDREISKEIEKAKIHVTNENGFPRLEMILDQIEKMFSKRLSKNIRYGAETVTVEPLVGVSVISKNLSRQLYYSQLQQVTFVLAIVLGLLIGLLSKAINY